MPHVDCVARLLSESSGISYMVFLRNNRYPCFNCRKKKAETTEYIFPVLLVLEYLLAIDAAILLFTSHALSFPSKDFSMAQGKLN